MRGFLIFVIIVVLLLLKDHLRVARNEAALDKHRQKTSQQLPISN
jgi:hypothetical protein